MARDFDNRTVVYPLLRQICSIGERASLLHHARRRFGRYLAVEFLILFSFGMGIVLILTASSLPSWLRVLALIASMYRISTMALAQVSILLLNTAKSTPGDRVHSRLRYLGLAGLNFAEVVVHSTFWLLCMQRVGDVSHHFSGALPSRSAAVLYCFNLATTIGNAAPTPLSVIAHVHYIAVATLGIEIMVVVLAIVLAIRPEDEVRQTATKLRGAEYWDWRARHFDELEWTYAQPLIDAIIGPLKARKAEAVVDVGCGIGQVCRALAFEGFSVAGVDDSREMLRLARERSADGIEYIEGDACRLPSILAPADAVVMRMLLHNVLPDWRKPLDEARRVLRKDGIIVIVEVFPPQEVAAPFFREVVSLAHDRNYFTEEVLARAVASRGFTIVERRDVLVPRCSVRAWLENTVPEGATKRRLMNMHYMMSEEVKRAYDAVLEDDDVLITIRFHVIIAQANGVEDESRDA